MLAIECFRGQTGLMGRKRKLVHMSKQASHTFTRRRSMKWLMSVSLALLGFMFSMAPAGGQAAESAADFYKKNKLTMVIGTGPGGASDVGARLFAKYWPEVTDGGEVAVKNMPGAAGIVALNFMQGAKPDGLTMNVMMFNGAYQMPFFQHNKAAKYDPRTFKYIVGGFREPWILTANKKFKSLDDFKNTKGLRYGVNSPYCENTFAALPMIRGLDLDVQLVTGYKSQTEIDLAVGKGEIDFTMTPLSQGLRAVEQGLVAPTMLVVAPERTPALPDVPALPEVVKMSPEDKKLFDEAMNLSSILRMAAMRGDVPDDRVQYVRDAIAKMVEMPAFQEDAKKILKLGATPVMGKELDELVKDAFTIDYSNLIEYLKPYVK